MSAIPPKQTPDAPYEAPDSSGGLVAMYNAASHAGAESFPVLKAFQDYIEAERTQARKRVMQLSVFYAVLMGVVVTGFLTAGIFMLRNMSSMQSKLLDVALAAKTAPAPTPAPAPVVVQAAPAVEESMRQMSRATAELQSALGRKLDGVGEVANQVNAKMASQDGELEKLRSEMKNMQEQSAKLKDELVAIKAEAKKPVHQPFSYTPPPVRPAPAAPAAPAQQTVAAPTAAPVPAPVAASVVAPVAAPVAVPAVPAVAAAAPKQPEVRDSRFPPAVKEPPKTPAGVKAPPPPQGMLATAIPLKAKNMGSLPWRVLIPE